LRKQRRKYINAFCRDFDHEQLNLQLFKGDIELDNVVLNEAVLQSLLNLPPSLRLESARAARVHINLSWSRLKKQPVQHLHRFTRRRVGRAAAHRPAASERAAALVSAAARRSRSSHARRVSRPRRWRSASWTDGGKPANRAQAPLGRRALLENLRLVVDDVHVVVRTRGRPRERGGTDMPPSRRSFTLMSAMSRIDTDRRRLEALPSIAQLLAARKAANAPVDRRAQAYSSIEAMTLAIGGATADEPGAVTLGSLGAAAARLAARSTSAWCASSSVPLAVRLAAAAQRRHQQDRRPRLSRWRSPISTCKFTLAQWKRAMWAIEGLLWCLDRKKVRDADGAVVSRTPRRPPPPRRAPRRSSRRRRRRVARRPKLRRPASSSSSRSRSPRACASSTSSTRTTTTPSRALVTRRARRRAPRRRRVNGESTEAVAARRAVWPRALVVLRSAASLLELSENATNGWNCVANDLRVVLLQRQVAQRRRGAPRDARHAADGAAPRLPPCATSGPARRRS
jgi:hypothetical protein